jgi:hypothetical protein
MTQPHPVELPGRPWKRSHFTLAVIHAVAQLWVVRWNMRILGFLVLLAFVFRLSAADSPVPLMDNVWSIGSELQTSAPVQFMSRVTREQLARTPAWDPASEFPPLSPRKAEEASRAMLKKLLGERRWSRQDILLKPFDVTTDDGDHREIRWLYVLHFGLLTDTGDESGAFNIIVLMDGTVMEPKPVAPKPVIQKPPATNAPPPKAAATNQANSKL